jgi:glycosyltransferase involved in cell wall biosynthesis
MAAGLPLVAPAVDRIPSLVADGREGLLYDPRPGAGGHAEALADTLVTLKDPALRARLGAAARARAARDYSWTAHCKALETAIMIARDAPARRAKTGG